VENITEVYKKCLSLYACALKTMHEIVEQAAHEENSTEEDHWKQDNQQQDKPLKKINMHN